MILFIFLFFCSAHHLEQFQLHRLFYKKISAPVPGGGYATVTGTSFAVPFVSGSAALLMEWGIVKGNDPFLYGEKVKAYLRKGAQSVGGYEEYPNVEVGWGRLCLAESIPYGIS